MWLLFLATALCIPVTLWSWYTGLGEIRGHLAVSSTKGYFIERKFVMQYMCPITYFLWILITLIKSMSCKLMFPLPKPNVFSLHDIYCHHDFSFLPSLSPSAPLPSSPNPLSPDFSRLDEVLGQRSLWGLKTAKNQSENQRGKLVKWRYMGLLQTLAQRLFLW